MRHFCTNCFKAFRQAVAQLQHNYLVLFPRKKPGKAKSLPLSISHLRSLSRYSFLCHPSSVSAQVCRSPESPRSAGQQRRDKPLVPAQKRPPRCVFFFLPSDPTNPRLPVVGGRLFKGLVELELDFSSFEGALRLHAYNPLVVHGHYQIGLGPIPHLPGRKSHTCRVGGQDHQDAWNTTHWWVRYVWKLIF